MATFGKKIAYTAIGVVALSALVMGFSYFSSSAKAAPKKPPLDPPKPGPNPEPSDLLKEAAACTETLATLPLEDPGYGVKPVEMSDADWYTRVALHKAYPGSVWPSSGPPTDEFPVQKARYQRLYNCIVAGLNPGPVPPQLPGTVERPGYVVTPSCGGVTVSSIEFAMTYARNVAQQVGQQYATVPEALAAAEADYYGGCTWQMIRDVAPIFWYRMRIGFFRGAVDVGIIGEANAQTQINNMRAFPPQGIDPSMMTPFNIWGDMGEQG